MVLIFPDIVGEDIKKYMNRKVLSCFDGGVDDVEKPLAREIAHRQYNHSMDHQVPFNHLLAYIPV